jgi:hypothetical protein
MTSTAKSEQETPSNDPSLIDELTNAVATGGVKERLRILQRITDLFVAGSHSYSDEQITLFDNLIENARSKSQEHLLAIAQRLTELLLMQAAGRGLSAEDLDQALERYKKLRPETARNIIKFREKRKKMRAQGSVSEEKAGKRENGAAPRTAASA